MKILGISFGRKMHNCDIVTIQALMAAKKAGADVKFINTMDLEIGHCKGCGACSALRDKGKQIKCILKDDYLTLENEILDADGVIVAAPVYSIAPTGQLKNYIDRFGAAHDRAAALAEQEKRIKNGSQELLDERLFKDKYVAYISVGGAHTPNWVSMGLPNMYMFGMSSVMKTVGQIDAYDMGHRTNPVLDQPFLDKVAGLGQHLAESIGKPYDEVAWYGEEGVCPVCHNKLLSVGKTTAVECPLCGIYGKLSIDGERLNVTFSKEEQKRARNTYNGLLEHCVELKEMMNVIIPKLDKHKDFIDEEMEKYRTFQSTY